MPSIFLSGSMEYAKSWLAALKRCIESTFFEQSNLKLPAILGGLTLSDFIPADSSLRFIIVLVIADLVTGFTVGWKLRRISSRKFATSFMKLICYVVMLLVARQASYTMQFAWLSPVFVTLITITELLSLLENINIIVPEFIPKWILTKLEIGNSSCIIKKRIKRATKPTFKSLSLDKKKV